MPSLTIDSNILIYHLQGEATVRDLLERWFREGNHLFISVITRLELLAAPILRNGEEKVILELLNHFLLIPVDAQIADLAARIRRTYGLKLGDSIIAATAVLLNATLVTRNLRDFKKVKGLPILKI